MKGTVIVALLACTVLTSAMDNYEWIEPPAPCSWTVTEECVMNGNTYLKSKYYAFGRYFAQENYNKHGDVIMKRVERPDYTYQTPSDAYQQTFTYAHGQCMEDGDEATLHNYGQVENLPGYFYSYYPNYLFIKETKYNGKKCRVYYGLNSAGDPDESYKAYYVDSDGYIIGVVDRADEHDTKVCNYTYGTYVTMSDFTFSKRKMYGCADERIYNTPEAFYAQCSASTSGAALAVVISALVAVLVCLF